MAHNQQDRALSLNKMARAGLMSNMFSGGFSYCGSLSGSNEKDQHASLTKPVRLLTLKRQLKI